MSDKKNTNIDCLRCGGNMTIIGTKKFSEGIDWSTWLGDWGKLLNTQEKLDMLGCLHCGKVEFFFHEVLTKNQKNEQ